MTTYWLLGERPAIDLISDPLDASEATLSNDTISLANVSLTGNTNSIGVSGSVNGTRTSSNPLSPGVNMTALLPPTCTSPDNNCSSRDRQSVCFDKDIPNSVIIDPNNRRQSGSREQHQQDQANNITKSLIEA